MGQYSDAWQAVQRGGGQLGPRNKQDASLLLDLTRRFGDRDKLFRDAVRLLRAYGDDEQFSATALVTAYTPSAESRPEQVVEPDDTEQEAEDHVEESLAELHTVTADFFSRYPDSTLFRRITFTDPQEAIEQMAEMMSQGAAARDNLYRQVADGALPAGILTAVGVRTYVEAFLLRAGNALRVESANPTDLALEDADAIPDRYRTLAATAAFTGLRWGECAGLFWEAVDLGARRLRVVRVLIEVSGQISVKPYPKSRAGRRSVPVPAAVVELLVQHRQTFPSPELVFVNSVGGPVGRTSFRTRVWKPALRRAGLPEALRFHDLRHSYATWLVTEGVPPNVVQKIMGHEDVTTTLGIYTDVPADFQERVDDALVVCQVPVPVRRVLFGRSAT
jgi:integrase